jgi:hypothetical protein
MNIIKYKYLIMEAIDFFPNNSKNTVYIKKSNIKNGGDGLFSKKYIVKGTSVTIYYGHKITDKEIYDLYTTYPDIYYEINRYIRGTPNGYAVNGQPIICDKTKQSNNFLGVFVNDISCIACKKDEINEKVLRNYARTIDRCNVRTEDTTDYPVYVATKRIKKKEEIYAHYGIGNWLSYIGCSPEEISDLNKEYKFSSLYL